mmetsp:Transcript_28181/g.42660  ORF Transcript_28181/g.42660 Transcript_28181/m.42660 type:complete len:201 (-) Transcript_28181:1487-2089(-)
MTRYVVRILELVEGPSSFAQLVFKLLLEPRDIFKLLASVHLEGLAQISTLVVLLMRSHQALKLSLRQLWHPLEHRARVRRLRQAYIVRSRPLHIRQVRPLRTPSLRHRGLALLPTSFLVKHRLLGTLLLERGRLLCRGLARRSHLCPVRELPLGCILIEQGLLVKFQGRVILQLGVDRRKSELRLHFFRVLLDLGDGVPP